MKNLLVTGGAGFIGSNFVRLMLSERKDCRLVVLDALTYAGNLENLEDVLDDFVFVRGDICDGKLVDEILRKYDIDTVVNFAAESHVDRSISDPSVFVRTNVLGTQTLLDCARRYWKACDSDKCQTYRDDVRFLQVSTDETYGDITGDYKFTEKTPIAPSSPYSASKAGADHLVMAYRRTYKMPVNITRCSNNYGPYQFPEKLIPVVIQKALSDSRIPVYGDGMQIRDWIHVEDHCRGIKAVLERGRVGDVYNIGSDNERANIEIVRLILRALGKPESLIEHVTDRLGHDRHYAIDSSKIMSELGWRPTHTFEEGIQSTIRWYVEHGKWMENILSGEYMAFNETIAASASDILDRQHPPVA